MYHTKKYLTILAGTLEFLNSYAERSIGIVAIEKFNSRLSNWDNKRIKIEDGKVINKCLRTVNNMINHGGFKTIVPNRACDSGRRLGIYLNNAEAHDNSKIEYELTNVNDLLDKVEKHLINLGYYQEALDMKFDVKEEERKETTAVLDTDSDATALADAFDKVGVINVLKAPEGGWPATHQSPICVEVGEEEAAKVTSTFTTNQASGRPYNNVQMDAFIKRVSALRGEMYMIEIVNENGELQQLKSWSVAAHNYYKSRVGSLAMVIRNNRVGYDEYRVANDIVANKISAVTEPGWSKWVDTSTGGLIRFNNAEGIKQIVFKSNGQWKIMESVNDAPSFPIDDLFNTPAEASNAAEEATGDNYRLSEAGYYF